MGKPQSAEARPGSDLPLIIERAPHGRPDVLFRESDPLEEDLTMTGDPVAYLFASTSGTGDPTRITLPVRPASS